MPTTRTRTRTYVAGPLAARYSRDSVERALDLHLGKDPYRGWAPHSSGGYTISTGVGILRLKTLREAYLFVVAMAEKGRRLTDPGYGSIRGTDGRDTR